MSRTIHAYELQDTAEPQRLEMPRRARILGVAPGRQAVAIHAEVFHDADTRAFDVAHSRTFVISRAGSAVLDGAVYVGSSLTMLKPGRSTPSELLHVYEIPPVKPTGL